MFFQVSFNDFQTLKVHPSLPLSRLAPICLVHFRFKTREAKGDGLSSFQTLEKAIDLEALSIYDMYILYIFRERERGREKCEMLFDN